MSADGIDVKLLAADATLVSAFTFARTLGTILMSPSFPGWLAPITADPVRLSTTVQFASVWTVFWVLAAAAFDAFDPGVSDQARGNIGPANAAVAFGGAAMLYVITAAVLSGVAPELQPIALRLNLENAVGGLGLGLSLFAWRAVLQESLPR